MLSGSSRRTFLSALLAAPGALGARELDCDVAIIGGGVGGCAAALGALRNGMRVILTEETDWIGGQLTSQAVPPDEHPYIESFGCTQAYREYRNAVRQYYRENYPLTEAARQNRTLNPGNAWVSRLSHEPRVSLAVLENMLAPYASGGRLTVLLRHVPVEAGTAGDSVRAVTAKSSETGHTLIVHARYFLDATEQGDLLPLTNTEYVTGCESGLQTHEMHAPEEPRPHDIQSFTVCFAMDYMAGEDHTIEKPREYGLWRDYVPHLMPPWAGKLFSLEPPQPATLTRRPMSFDPECESPGNPPCLWTYRRIADKKNFTPGSFLSDISLVNWPQNDYWLGNLYNTSAGDAAKNLERSRQLSLSLFYWLQTEVPRPGGGYGWPGLRLRPDVTGTEDGLAKYPYIRESRRIQAEFTVLEQHVGTEARMKATAKSTPDVTAEAFSDAVGIGSYRIDLHPSTGGRNYIDISSLPFQIPLGALIPKRVNNLLAASKDLGVTHITNGCYRLHPVEWNIGEAAGCAAAHAIQLKTTPRYIRNTPKRLAEFQAKLREQGVELSWPRVTPR